MQSRHEQRSELTLVGFTTRTNNKQEADKMNGKIWPIVRDYYHQQQAEQIPNRAKPGTTICAYTDYESDHNGDYTYFIGEEVSSVDEASLPEGMQLLRVPAQRYCTFTTDPAPMPDVIVNAWHAIWNMGAKDFGGERSYETDFEVYDERAADHSAIVMDICIGVKG